MTSKRINIISSILKSLANKTNMNIQNSENNIPPDMTSCHERKKGRKKERKNGRKEERKTERKEERKRWKE